MNSYLSIVSDVCFIKTRKIYHVRQRLRVRHQVYCLGIVSDVPIQQPFALHKEPSCLSIVSGVAFFIMTDVAPETRLCKCPWQYPEILAEPKLPDDVSVGSSGHINATSMCFCS